MEHLNNVFINVDDYSLLNDKKLFTQPRVRIKRLSQNLQRRYSPPKVVRGILSTDDKKTRNTKSVRFRIFSETRLLKIEDSRSSVLKEDQPPDSLPRCSSSSDAYCHQILNFISDQIPGISHPSDPLLTSDLHSQSSQIAEKEQKDCFEDVSKRAQPDDSYVSNLDTRGSQSLSTLALEDESGKTAIPPSSFNDWADSKEANCPPSTGRAIINFSAKDRNSDDDDGACEAVDGGRMRWTNDIQTVRTDSMIKSEKTIEKNSEIRAESDDNSCVLKKEDSQFAEEICYSVENISKEAHPVDSFVANVDTGSFPSLNVHALVDNSGKSAVSPSAFDERMELNETNCPPSTGMDVINFSTKDRISDDDDDCAANDDSGILWTNGVQTGKSESAIKCENSFVTFSEIGAEKQTEVNCESSCRSLTETKVANFFAEDSLVHGGNDGRNSDDDEDCGDGGDDEDREDNGDREDYKDLGNDIDLGNDGDLGVDEDHGDSGDRGDDEDRGDNGDAADRGDNEDRGAIGDDKSFADVIQDVNSGILQVVKSEVDEDMIGCVKSIGTAVDNVDVKEEEDSKNVSCIDRQSDIQNAIPNTDVRQTRSRRSNTSSVLQDSSTTRTPLSSSKEHGDDVRRTRSSSRRSNTSSGRTPPPSSNKYTDLDDDDDDEPADDPSDEGWMPPKKKKKKTKTISSTDESRQPTSTPRSTKSCKEFGFIHGTKNSSGKDQVMNIYCQGEGGSLTKSQNSCISTGITVVNILIKCIHCESSIISLEDLREHVTVHIDLAIMNTTEPNCESVETPGLSCFDCGEAFSNQDDFSSHCHRHGSKFACFVCDERFALLKELRAHVEWHFDEIPYTCYLCSAKFSTRSMYEEHVSEHKRGLKFKCIVCGGEYSDFNTSKIHLQFHCYSDNQKKCGICGRGFSRPGEMHIHLATDHSTEKLYSYLEQCSKSISPYYLQREADKIQATICAFSKPPVHVAELGKNPKSEDSVEKLSNSPQTIEKFSHGIGVTHPKSEESVEKTTNFPKTFEELSNSKGITHPKSEEYVENTQKIPQTIIQEFSHSNGITHNDKSTPDENKDVEKEPIKCLHCESTFISLVDLLDHVNVHIDPAILNADPELVCGDCALAFSNQQDYISHCRSHDHIKPFRCQICDHRFDYIRSILYHNARMHSEPKLPCFVCNKRFAILYGLNKHIRWHFDGIVKRCSLCPAEFASAAKYEIHRSKHLGLTIFKCPECAEEFPDKNRLKSHMRNHNLKKKSTLCPVCGKAFGNVEGMRTHFESKHCTEKPLTCALCPKKFSGNRWLEKHMNLIHHGNQYKCSLCDKSFASKFYLATHSWTHSGEKPFSCEICNKKFVVKSAADRHMKTHRVKSSEKTFQCKLCDKSYFNYPNLQDHKRVKHDAQRFVCNLCGKDLTRSQTLRQHMKTHDK